MLDQWGRRKVRIDALDTFPFLRGIRRDIDQTENVSRSASDVADHVASVGMAHQDRRTGEGGERLARRGDIIHERGEGILHRQHVISLVLKEGDHLAPT